MKQKKNTKNLQKINKKTFTFTKKVRKRGINGTIKKQITNLIKEKTELEVAPSHVILKDELNKIGSFTALINFHTEVKASITIKIDKIKSN